jgi:hypothetical protein
LLIQCVHDASSFLHVTITADLVPRYVALAILGRGQGRCSDHDEQLDDCAGRHRHARCLCEQHRQPELARHAEQSYEEKAIANRAYLSRPDFIMITGDIVYGDGRISECREKYWPIMNANEACPSEGAPLDDGLRA